MKSFCRPINYHCPVCSFKGSARIKYSFSNQKIYECPVCLFKFLYPQPTKHELRELYKSEEYFFNGNFFNGENDHIFGYADYYAERFNKQRQFTKIARKCMQLLINYAPSSHTNKFKLIEIGCGPGFFLEAAKEIGFEVSGIEFNPNIISKYTNQPSCPIKIEDYEKTSDHEPEAYDCIVLLDVIEHFRNPIKVIENTYQSLVPGGILVISTTDSGSLTSQILGKRLEDFRRVREHLYFFNRKNISTLLRKRCFRIYSIESIGHTFRLDHLFNRLRLMFPVLMRPIYNLLQAWKTLGQTSLYINPRTKIIVYARKQNNSHLKEVNQRIKEDLHIMQSSNDYYHHYIYSVREIIAGKKILELGSGMGSATEALLSLGARRIVGLDVSMDLVKHSEKRFNDNGLISKVKFVNMDIEEDLDSVLKIIKDEEIDVVFSFNFLEHVFDDGFIIEKIYEALPDKGQLINILPYSSLLFNKFDEAYQHYRRYDICDIKLRFKPFMLHSYRKFGMLKYLGWLSFKMKPYQGIKKTWDFYNSFLFPIDRVIDNLLGGNMPFGATLISVHQKLI